MMSILLKGNSRWITAFISICATMALFSCWGEKPASTGATSGLNLAYENYTLENGLKVILHEDRSDPIVSVAILFHVGSNREEKGRTGFAHLFEHMLFQESQHVSQDQFFKKIQDAGGTLNGGTWQDGTIYYEVVPNNALEMVLWMESDRMGFLLSTVTQEAFNNQQDVVQNEKRQRVDNRPYGHTNYVIDKNLYPEDHPYNWQVIGSFEDLKNATLDDIRDFFTKWYGPNNATLVIAGDFDQEQTKVWVEKYFGEIKSSEPVEKPQPMPVSLAETKRVFHEDNFAKSPELNMVYPSARGFHKDSYPLTVLADLLADGKKAPLYRVLVEEKKLAPSVSGFQDDNEIAGVLRFRVRAFPGKSLTEVEQAIFEALRRFETEGFSDGDLSRIKAQVETQFYDGITSSFQKSFQLAQYNEYTGSPGFINEDLQGYMDVTREDVMRVYETYIKDKPYVLTSFVPKGETGLVAKDSVRFPVVEEDIGNAGVGENVAEVASEEIPKIPTSFDRTVEPPKGEPPTVNLPAVWHEELDNGLKLLGIEYSELPLVRLTVRVSGGLLLDDIEKIGVANLVSDMMMEGTQNKTPVELEEAILSLGASIEMYTENESIVLRVNTLKSKFSQTLALVREILLEPRWDEKEFERIKNETIENINRRNSRPSLVATNVFNKLIYGKDNILAYSALGSVESVNAITIDDLKDHYARAFSPKSSFVALVGGFSSAEAKDTFRSLGESWSGEEVALPELTFPEPRNKPELYFVDVPNAKQSEIRVGALGPAYTHPDYNAIEVMCYKLGGSFNSILNLILREEKGYTYGARARFRGTSFQGSFMGNSAVRSNVTFESAEIFKDEIAKYREGIGEEDLAFTKNALIKSNARRLETPDAMLAMLNDIGEYGLADDYIKSEENVAREMTLERHRELAQKYLPRGLVFLVVGDAETQLEPLKKLGLGDPVLLDREGGVVSPSPPAAGGSNP